MGAISMPSMTASQTSRSLITVAAVMVLTKFDAYAAGAGCAPVPRLKNEAEVVLDTIASSLSIPSPEWKPNARTCPNTPSGIALRRTWWEESPMEPSGMGKSESAFDSTLTSEKSRFHLLTVECEI